MCCISALIWVRLTRIRGSIGVSSSLRHHVGRRNAALLHPRVHSARVIHEAGHHMCRGGRRVVVLGGLGALATSSCIVAVEVKELFGAFGSL